MKAERVGAVQPGVELNGEHQDEAPESFTTVPPIPLKIAQRPERNRVQFLRELAGSLLRETDALARDRAFTEETNRLQSLNLSKGIDFYEEVQRFESGLIRLALDQTRGHQARAADLLHIKPTTLNSKIKLYGIEY
jgi:DNA-binding NtrC family response regulator